MKHSIEENKERFVVSDAEIEIIIRDVYQKHNIDFSFYARDAFARRINRLFNLEKYKSFEEFRFRLLNDENYIHHFIDRITVNITEMFRDPEFFKCLREEVIPSLALLPKIRIWHPGCSTGEEIISMAIILHEAGLLDKAEFLGTDINQFILQKAKHAIVNNSLLPLYQNNYLAAGGKADFSQYYTLEKTERKFHDFLTSKIRYQLHNLACDQQPLKFDLIICRNVIIYFSKKALQETFLLLEDCTSPGAFLALGEKETIQLSGAATKFSKSSTEKIWKKTG